VRPIGPGGRQTTALRYPRDFPSTPACAPCAFQCRDKIRSPSNLCNMANYEQASICGSVSWRPVIGGAFPRTRLSFLERVLELCAASSAPEPTIECAVRSGRSLTAAQPAAYATHHHQLRRVVQRRSYQDWHPPRATPAARGVTEPPKPINAMAAP
jgi:hypothetical protein